MYILSFILWITFLKYGITFKFLGKIKENLFILTLSIEINVNKIFLKKYSITKLLENYFYVANLFLQFREKILL